MSRPLESSQLYGRCGGCVHFQPVWTAYRGQCRLGPIRKIWGGKETSNYRQQSQKACFRYQSAAEDTDRKETEP
jgi:hypothetical protein